VNLTHDVNNKIRAKEVRVIDNNGEQIGVLALADAQKLADECDLDLVVINPKSAPPIARIVDYGKFKYELVRSEKERKKKSRENIIDVKEVQLRPVTDTHDVEIKAKRAKSFLEDGDKVKVVVRFKGRELSHREMGQKIIDSFCVLVGEENYKVDSPVQMSGRQMSMILSPNRK